MVNQFGESVDAILEDVSVTEAIVRCLSINWKLSSVIPLKLKVVRHV